MEVGAAVWIQQGNEWNQGIIKQRDVIKHITEVTLLPTNTIITIHKESQDSIQLMNKAKSVTLDDLINLTFLNEPEILHSLEMRYTNNLIYTFTGPILIAINPFKNLDIYNTSVVDMYRNYGILAIQGVIDTMGIQPLPPHIYAISDALYRDMNKIIHIDYTGKANANQIVLISGESGAGKTETTKYILKYLTILASESLKENEKEKDHSNIMDKVMQSNPILEAFGNARTLKNDNSSRFGRYIDLHFSVKGTLVSGSLNTYLLENSRVCTQVQGERNYHIFYQMCSGDTTENKLYWEISNIKAMYYINQGNIFELPNISDKNCYNDVLKAFKIFEINLFKDELCNILAGILHLGQICIVSDTTEEDSSMLCKEMKTDKSMKAAAKLFGLVDSKQLETLLLQRQIKTKFECISKKLTRLQALDTRDSLAKTIYRRLFHWIVKTINLQFATAAVSEIRSSIGVLDIFGFESFKNNSFEQFCINYTNEALQQQFNEYIFVSQQKLYAEEGIEWAAVAFPNNQDCIDLIEMKQKGVIAMLDDECMLPKGNATKFASRMYTAFDKHTSFSASPAQKNKHEFCIQHYAGIVVYSSESFLEKNKDETPSDAIDVCCISKNKLLVKLFMNDEIFPSNESSSTTTPDRRKSSSQNTLSVCSQFKEQLTSLINTIKTTSPHYVRCIKPNDTSSTGVFDRMKCAEQLRNGGILSAVQVCKSGFQYRYSHIEFYSRYRPIANMTKQRASDLPKHIYSAQTSKSGQFCTRLWQALIDESESTTPISRKLKKQIEFWRVGSSASLDAHGLQVGKTIVFMKDQIYDFLEARITKFMNVFITRIQALMKGVLFRRKYMRYKRVILVLQTRFRCRCARKIYQSLKLNHKAFVLQRAMRFLCSRHRLMRFRKAVIAVQSKLRKMKAEETLRWLRFLKEDCY